MQHTLFRSLSFSLSLAISGILTPVVLAQDFRATITGQVTDPSQAAVPNATVRATRSDSNVSSEVTTNAQGYFTLPYLNPGTYDIEAVATGFKTLKRTGIILQVADRLNVPLVLELGDISSAVTVTGEQEILQTETASRGLVFDPMKTSELPLNGRQSYMLMALTPGVIFTQEEFGASGFSGTRGWDTNGSYKINGGRGGNQFLLNGAPISVNGSWQVSPNVEAIQEFKVMTNTYDAQYGRTWGGTVNTTVKSGTNEWHGTAFDFLRNSVLDANTTQNNLNGAPRGKHITNQFGGVLGGPIRKDKDFVFFSDESFRERVPFPAQTTTVPMDMRDGTGFSNWGVTIFDPMTTHGCVQGQGGITDCHNSAYVRNPFPNNVIPASRISPIGKQLLAIYPSPNYLQNGLNSNYIASGNVGKYKYDQPMGRWDRVLTDKDRLYAMFTFQHGQEYRSHNGWKGAGDVGDDGSERTFQQYMLDWTRVLNSRMVLDVRASFSRFTEMFPNGNIEEAPLATALGMNMPQIPTVQKHTAPRIEMDGLSDIIGTKASWNTTNHFDLSAGVTHTINRHSLHYGFEFARFDFGNADPGNANGRFHFDRGWTQQFSGWGAGQSDGSPVASLLLGYPAWGGVDYNNTFYRRNPYYAGYIQDDWKVRPNLTLNLGLRYDVQVPFTELHNRVNAGFDFGAVSPISDPVIAQWKANKAAFDATNPAYPYPNVPSAIYGGKLFAGVGGQPTKPYDTDWTDVQPRFGFAWNLISKTVVRGGFGIYHKTVDQGNLTDGFSQATNYVTSLNGMTPSAGTNLTGSYSLANPYPTGILVPQGAALGLLTNIGNGVGIDGRQRVLPRTYEYSFTLERQLPSSMTLEVSYVGNITKHDTLCCDGINLNGNSLSDFNRAHQDSNYLDQQVPNPFRGIAPASTGLGSNATVSRSQLMRAFPQFNDVNFYTNPWAHYRYDAFQLKLEKRLLDSRAAGAMTFVVSYTFSKAYEANHWYNRWNYANEEMMNEVEYQDKPQSFAFSGVWDLPFGKGKRFGNSNNPVISRLTSNWTLDWIYTYYSGYPTGKPGANFGCAQWKTTNQSYDQWFNNDPSCWKSNPSYTLRTYDDRFSNIRNPSAPQINIAVAKSIPFSERMRLTLRGEAFNLTNTPIPYGPNTDWWSDRLGKIPQSQQNFPRLVQVAAKFSF